MRRIATTARHLGFFANTTPASSSLFQYVSKNETLFERFGHISMNPVNHHQSLETIIQSVHGNNFSEDVFHELTRDKATATTTLNHILYLIKNDKINFDQGLTLYQFVSVAAYKFCPDSAYIDKYYASLPCEIQLMSMVENNQLTEAGQQYLKTFHVQMRDRTSLQLDEAELTEAIINLPVTEQKFIKMPIHFNRIVSDASFYQLTEQILYSVPLFGDCTKNYFIYPSVGFMNLVFSKMTGHPVTAKPILGEVKIETVMELHQNGQHPVMVHNDDIKSSPKLVHAVICGPVIGGVHDWSHLFLINTLTFEERQFLFQKLIPFLQSLDQYNARDYADAINTDSLKAFTWTLSDIALPYDAYTSYVSPIYRFSNYVNDCITSIFLNEAKRSFIPTPTPEKRKFVLTKLSDFIAFELESAEEPLRTSLGHVKSHVDQYRLEEEAGYKRNRMNPFSYDD